MNKKLKYALIGAMMGVMAITVGCGDNASDAPTTLKVGVTNFADSLEPTDNYFSWVVVRYGIGETLVKFDKQMKPVAWIADTWEVSPDHTTWTFHIDDKATFSNGNKVTADAVKKSLERVFAKSKRAKTFFEYTNIEADGQKLIIHTTKPVPTLPGMLADPLFLIVDTSVDRDYAKEGPIGTGPYVVKTYSKEKAVLGPNEHYWRGPVPFKDVEVPTLDDPSTRAMALQSGEVNMAFNISPTDMENFRKDDKFNIYEIASLRTVMGQLNMNADRPLSDLRVREALLSSLDLPTINKTMLKGDFIAGKAPVPPSLDFGFDQLKDNNTYNVERAEKLLKEAGYTEKNADGILMKDGKPLTVTLVYYAGRIELPIYAEATQAYAKKIGIDVKLQKVDYNVLDGMRQKGEYDIIISNWLTANTGDPEMFLNWMWKTNANGDNPQNSSGFSSPEFDALSAKLSTEFDPEKRRQYIIEMQQIIMNQAAGIFYGYPKTNVVAIKGLAGVEMFPADYYWITSAIRPAK